MSNQKRISDVEFKLNPTIEENGISIHIEFITEKDKMRVLQLTFSDGGLNTCDYSLMNADETIISLLKDYLKEVR